MTIIQYTEWRFNILYQEYILLNVKLKLDYVERRVSCLAVILWDCHWVFRPLAVPPWMVIPWTGLRGATHIEPVWVVPSGVVHCASHSVLRSDPDHRNNSDFFQNAMCGKWNLSSLPVLLALLVFRTSRYAAQDYFSWTKKTYFYFLSQPSITVTLSCSKHIVPRIAWILIPAFAFPTSYVSLGNAAEPLCVSVSSCVTWGC